MQTIIIMIIPTIIMSANPTISKEKNKKNKRNNKKQRPQHKRVARRVIRRVYPHLGSKVKGEQVVYDEEVMGR